MTFSWPSEIRAEAEHLVRLSKDPAWMDHARERTRERFADPVWAGLREEIDKVMREQRTAADAATGAKQ